MLDTVWKVQDFSVTHILREIKFGESRYTKTAVFAILRALKMVHLVNCSLQKVQIPKIQNSNPLNVVKTADFCTFRIPEIDFT